MKLFRRQKPFATHDAAETAGKAIQTHLPPGQKFVLIIWDEETGDTHFHTNEHSDMANIAMREVLNARSGR